METLLEVHDETALPFAFHPTGIDIDGIEKSHYVGCVVTGVVATATIALLSRAVAVGVSVQRRKTMWDAEGLIRVPSVPLIVWTTLSQGT
eukprot:gene8341-2474_t